MLLTVTIFEDAQMTIIREVRDMEGVEAARYHQALMSLKSGRGRIKAGDVICAVRVDAIDEE